MSQVLWILYIITILLSWSTELEIYLKFKNLKLNKDMPWVITYALMILLYLIPILNIYWSIHLYKYAVKTSKGE